ncbi:hypothetical protein OW763_16225 [Clostridium aestuarii]|uniref:Lipoprotein n=1 Tax=Clostridium aestuarii TaxID=338193 RepID=A0ABT4D6P2_9CLOT|nr:hypothetical protein [Clostridium aestuarii]MCY6485860.1 hypothetical protein [Clostridium aestuarii]
MRKKLYIICLFIISMLVLSACSIKNPFKKENKDVSVIDSQEQQVQNNESKMSTEDFLKKKKSVQKEYMVQREKLEEDRLAKSKIDIDAFEKDIVQKDKTKRKEYENKLEDKNKGTIDKINNNLKVEIAKINAEKTNIINKNSAEYNAEKTKNDESLKLVEEKIKQKYGNPSTITSQEQTELDKALNQTNELNYMAEKNKLNKDAEAEKQRAEKERIAKDNVETRKAKQLKLQETIKNSFDNMWNKYEQKIAKAKEKKDKNENRFIQETKKEYDDKFQNLSNDDIMTDTIWTNLILEENKEIIRYCNEQMDEYKNAVDEIIRLKEDELTKLVY